ncbi:MAG TPA: nucleotide disphospho-sugar-binding domain-containing protein, partial [bacterium]
IPEMDPLPKTTEVTYIGSVLWQKPGDILPTWIARLPDEPPVVWVYPGNTAYQSGTRTAFDSKVVLDACIEALANEAVQVVLTAGHHSLGRKAISLPANFRHVSYVPGLAMAERSQMLIHHGGYGSSQTGLVAGKPALIIPTYSERESNARRIAAQGAGDFILPESDASGKIKRVSAQEVHDKAMKILSEPSFAENARRIREKMQQYGGAPYAAYLIERQA